MVKNNIIITGVSIFLERSQNKQMKTIEEKLTGEIRKGYTVYQIWDAYDFYKLKFEQNYV